MSLGMLLWKILNFHFSQFWKLGAPGHGGSMVPLLGSRLLTVSSGGEGSSVGALTKAMRARCL